MWFHCVENWSDLLALTISSVFGRQTILEDGNLRERQEVTTGKNLSFQIKFQNFNEIQKIPFFIAKNSLVCPNEPPCAAGKHLFIRYLLCGQTLYGMGGGGG